MQPSLLHLGEMSEQACEDHSSLGDERMQIRQQFFVGQVREIHSSLLPSRFSTSGFAHQRTSMGPRTAHELAQANASYAADRGPPDWFSPPPGIYERAAPTIASTQIDMGRSFSSVAFPARNARKEARVPTQ
jgi:hypothetical protein